MAKVLKSPIVTIPYPKVSLVKYVFDKLKQFSPNKTVWFVLNA